MNRERYQKKEEIGEGGFGDIYLAEDLVMNRPAAIQELHHRGPEGRREVEILMRIKHPMFPVLYDAWEECYGYVLVMEFIRGKNLAEYLHIRPHLQMGEICSILSQTSEALSYLHTMNPPIAYRDLKPRNLMLGDDGKMRLVDMGSAREVPSKERETGRTTGTKGYCSRQQLNGEPADLRDDVYSFGILAHYLFTGQNPTNPPYEILPLEQYDKTIPEFWNQVIQKCTAREKEQRYLNMTEVKILIDRWMAKGGKEGVDFFTFADR